MKKNTKCVKLKLKCNFFYSLFASSEDFSLEIEKDVENEKIKDRLHTSFLLPQAVSVETAPVISENNITS